MPTNFQFGMFNDKNVGNQYLILIYFSVSFNLKLNTLTKMGKIYLQAESH